MDAKRSFKARQRSLQTPFYVSDNRIMLSLGPLSKGKYCTYSCPFCYVGGDFLSYASLGVDEIVEWAKAVRKPYDIVYVSCDTDSFAPPRESEALALLDRLTCLDVDLLFTTRAVLSDATLEGMEEIARSIGRRGRMLIGCVSVAQLTVPHLEPPPIPPAHERLAQLARLNAAGVQTVLALRPFLPNVPIDDYRELVRRGARDARVVLGGVWYFDRAGVLTRAVLGEGQAPESVAREMDFDSNRAVWQVYEGRVAEEAVRDECDALGVPVFMRSRPAVEWLRQSGVLVRTERAASRGEPMPAVAANEARRIACRTFEETLQALRGRSEVTEVAFRDEWMARLRANDCLTLNGWYEPPPMGMAILFAHEDDPTRLAFESLRQPEYTPGGSMIDWERGLMYAYCSPLHRPTGLAGDFAVTLYFGERADIRAHFKRAHRATNAVLAEFGDGMRSRALLERSERLFARAGLRNTVSSVTDAVPLDLGHSVPRVSGEALPLPREVNASTIATLRGSRRFVSASLDWELSEAEQVTIEPQLVATGMPELPQVSFHYVVATSSKPVTVLRECDALLDRFDLTG